MNVRKPTPEEVKMTQSWDTWRKESSEFPWSYDCRETCYILEGEAVVTGKDGNTITFGTGDWVVFEEGLECTWKISKTIRKKFLME